MGSEATVYVVTRHLLIATDSLMTPTTKIAILARDNRGYHNRFALPRCRPFAGCDDMSAYLMTEYEGQRVGGANAVVKVS